MPPSPPGPTPTSFPRRHAAVAVLSALLACLAVALAAPPAHASRACPSVHAMHARTAAAAHVERAVLCLMNRARMRAGRAPLRVNRCLDRSAARHTRDMVARRYFAHSSASGRSFEQRVRRFGYAARAPGWQVGENLAWGAGPRSRARWFVRAWMHSPSHRANILHGAFRDVGVAVLRGIPGWSRGLHRPRTITVDFGARGRSRC